VTAPTATAAIGIAIGIKKNANMGAMASTKDLMIPPAVSGA
jgi:hypothetical protein